MENDFYTDDFEQIVKEKADQFRMYPSKRVWHSIYNNLHPSRRWPSVLMSLFLITSLILIGHLNNGDNTINRQINNIASNNILTQPDIINNSSDKKQLTANSKIKQLSLTGPNNVHEDVIINKTDFYTYTIVKSNRPVYLNIINGFTDPKTITDQITTEKNSKEKELIQSLDAYIKSRQILSDVAINNKKNRNKNLKRTVKNINTDELVDDNSMEDVNPTATNKTASLNPATTNIGPDKLNEAEKESTSKISKVKIGLTNEEKAWIENFSLENAPLKNKWKSRFALSFYTSPAVNYRKLSTASKGSSTPFANSDINSVLSQKPGFGIEAGLGLSYAVAKRLQVKAGFQFNYTNYNIKADQTNHPILTAIVLNDPSTGNSYSAARISTVSNSFNSNPIRPVTLHNTTYQISIPIGFAYKISSQKNVDWFAGASVQPTYVFDGKAHLISSDLKSYVSDPSTINSWNLNLGFETYMNFKVGVFNLQVGPQVRYQVNSTYRKNVALIEKPYAVGLKFGLTKGF